MGYFSGKVDSPHALLELASKRIPGIAPVNVTGLNRSVDTTFETLWSNGGSYVYPTSAAQMSVVSTSASDTMAIVISGLDANYNSLVEIVNVTGTTPVTTVNSFLRINNATILTGSNVGDISISNGGTLYGFIEETLGTTQGCIYSVPAGSSLYLFRISITSGTVNGNKYVTYRNRLDTHTGRTLRVAEATMQSDFHSFDRQIPFRIPEKTDFQFEAKSSGGSNEVCIFIEALLMENKYAE